MSVAKFPQDSYDSVERKYGAIIIANFPNYGKFWELFIGQDKATTQIKWYDVIYPSTMKIADRRSFLRWREELAMAHFSLFCNLAGCHFQLSELINSIKIPITQDVFFNHWEHFECFYLRLGNCFYQIFHLWEVLARLNHSTLKDDRYIKQEGIQRQWKRFKDYHKKTAVLRNNLVHYSRIGHKQIANAFYVPKTIKEGDIRKNIQELWTVQLRRKHWIPTDVKMRIDLESAEKYFNSIHSLFIKQFGKLLRQKGLKIRR